MKKNNLQATQWSSIIHNADSMHHFKIYGWEFLFSVPRIYKNLQLSEHCRETNTQTARWTDATILCKWWKQVLSDTCVHPSYKVCDKISGSHEMWLEALT